MSYRIEFQADVLKTIRKMDSTSRRQVLKYVSKVLARIDDPRLLGKALTGNFGGFWRYRTGHFRIICKIYDAKLLILIVKIAHRKDSYND